MRQWHQQQPARLGISRRHEPLDGVEVLARLFVVEHHAPVGQTLQAKWRPLRVTHVATGKTCALVQEDRLHPIPERGEIPRRRLSACRRTLRGAAFGKPEADAETEKKTSE